MHLDNLLWQDRNEINVGELWKMLCTYCYLPRLASFEVLQTCIQNGVNSEDYFCLCGWRRGWQVYCAEVQPVRWLCGSLRLLGATDRCAQAEGRRETSTAQTRNAAYSLGTARRR